MRTGRVDAAVLVPLYVNAGDLHAVFTKRPRRPPAPRRRDLVPGRPPGLPRRGPADDGAPRGRGGDRAGTPRGRGMVGALPPTGTVVTNYKIHPVRGRDQARAQLDPAAAGGQRGARAGAAETWSAGHEMKRLVRKEACRPDRHLHTSGDTPDLGRDRSNRRRTCSSAGASPSASCLAMDVLLYWHAQRGSPTRSRNRRSCARRRSPSSSWSTNHVWAERSPIRQYAMIGLALGDHALGGVQLAELVGRP